MNTKYKSTVRGLLLIVLISFTAAPVFAQLDDVGEILQSSRQDANTLVREYLKPFGAGFGAGLNNGWTNTAKPHQTLGFDLTVSTALAFVPDADKTFNVNEIGLQQLQHESGPTVTPSISGPGDPGSTLAAYTTVNGQQFKLFDFTMPQGSGLSFVPAPMIKAGVGTIKDTDIMLRWTPEIDIGDLGTFKLFGIGAKHGINQWLPGGDVLPVNLSVMFGYTKMDVNADFSVTPDDVISDPANTENPYSASQWEGQGIELNTNAWTLNALVGKTLPVISVYGGIGIESSKFNILTPGSYPTVVPNDAFASDPQNNEPLIVDAVEEPLDVEIDGENGFHALAGFRLRFAVFHISASYTLAKYSSFNAGLGISFR